jgi:hypothetical protein
MKKLILFIFIFSFLQFAYATTYDEASLSINNSQSVLQEFQKAGFSIDFINDTIIESKIVLEQARYAEILRSSSSSESLKQEARSALRLVDWKNISYDSVLTYYSVIDSRKKQAYEIYDSLNVLDKKIKVLANQGVSTYLVDQYFNQSNSSFYEDRYEEAINTIDRTNGEIERINAENATLNVLGQNFKSFVYKNWVYIVIILIVIFIVVYFGYNRIRLFSISKKITRMRMDLVVLRGLSIKNQTDRFRDNKISALVYNIRAKKYEEKINEIKETLPVLENKLRRSRALLKIS